MTSICPLCNGPLCYPRFPSDERWRAVVETVASRHGMTVDGIRNGRRTSSIAAVRHEIVWELRRLDPPMGYQDCAQAVGLTNHTSAMAAVKKYARVLRAKAKKAA